MLAGFELAGETQLGYVARRGPGPAPGEQGAHSPVCGSAFVGVWGRQGQ